LKDCILKQAFSNGNKAEINHFSIHLPLPFNFDSLDSIGSIALQSTCFLAEG
jgi:hypothetical protein